MKKIFCVGTLALFWLLSSTVAVAAKAVVIPLGGSISVNNPSEGDLLTYRSDQWVAERPVDNTDPRNNMQPYLGISFIIALQGIFPSRSSISDPTLAEITMFAGTFAPRNWAYCDGQLLPISQNTALFSLLGTTFGGDGRTTFALPDLRGRVPVHGNNSAGPGLTPRRLGERGGSETTLRHRH